VTLVLELDDEGTSPNQAEVLGFVLDLTLEKWTAEEPDQIDLITKDPAFRSADELLEATGDYSALLDRLKEIRAKLNGRERDDGASEAPA
jgi:hypothetical protein